MKTLVDQLAQYAAYHRDRRNIATHLVGIPVIVFAITVLLSRPAFDVGGVAVTPALLAAAVTAIYYLALDLRYGVVMTLLLAASLWGAQGVAALPTASWLTAGIGLFVFGWVLQFIGHFWEGRKPAFVDDLIGLIIGPLFVVAEVGFALGLGNAVRAEVERRAGPTHGGRAAPVSGH